MYKCNNFVKGKEIHNNIKQCINSNNIQIKTTLIEFYDHFMDRKFALNIFESIDKDEMDIVCISTMMKCFIDGGQYKNALGLYDDNNICDNICNVLTIRVCIDSGEYDKGKYIHRKMKDSVKNRFI